MTLPEIDWVAALTVTFLFGGTTVAAVAAQWRKVRVAEQAAALKKELLDRGFTADEIVRVVEAGSAGGDRRADRCERA